MATVQDKARLVRYSGVNQKFHRQLLFLPEDLVRHWHVGHPTQVVGVSTRPISYIFALGDLHTTVPQMVLLIVSAMSDGTDESSGIKFSTPEHC